MDRVFPGRNGHEMLDLNDLRVFERVAALRSFSSAARGLGLPKSSVSRSVARLESAFGSRLLQRSTRGVMPTETGQALLERCADILGRVGDTVDYISSLGSAPVGMLRISAGIGFGVNVLSEILPTFLLRFPSVEISVDLTSRVTELISESIDVAIRMGPMPNSQFVATKLGTIRRYPCAAPAYLERRGTPQSVAELANHETVEMPSSDGRPRPWEFTNTDGQTVTITTRPRLCVNDALTIHRAVINGAGIGCLSGYLCAPDVASGRLVRLLPGWSPPPVDVSLVFPTNRELAPSVRAFVNFMKEVSAQNCPWQNDSLRG